MYKGGDLQLPAELCVKGEKEGALQVASDVGMKQVPAAPMMSQSGKMISLAL